MTAGQVDVPAGIYSVHSRPSAEACSFALSICDDVERAAAWRILERPGLGVPLAIGKPWRLRANLKGVASPDGVGQAGMGFSSP